MLFWNIFTILFGCLVAALSQNNWKQFIGKNRDTLAILFLLSTSTLAISILFWLIATKELVTIMGLNYTHSPWSASVSTISGIGMPILYLVVFLTRVLLELAGRGLLKYEWSASFSKKSWFAIVLFALTTYLMPHKENISGIFDLALFGFLLLLGAVIWLFFVVGLSNRTSDQYSTKIANRAIAIIVIALITSMVWHIIGSPESIISTIKTNIDRDLAAAIDLI